MREREDPHAPLLRPSPPVMGKLGGSTRLPRAPPFCPLLCPLPAPALCTPPAHQPTGTTPGASPAGPTRPPAPALVHGTTHAHRPTCTRTPPRACAPRPVLPACKMQAGRGGARRGWVDQGRGARAQGAGHAYAGKGRTRVRGRGTCARGVGARACEGNGHMYARGRVPGCHQALVAVMAHPPCLREE